MSTEKTTPANTPKYSVSPFFSFCGIAEDDTVVVTAKVNEEEAIQKIVDKLNSHDSNVKRIEDLEAALDEIINPIKYMQLRLKEGEKLDGQYAVINSNSASYLRDIARRALTK